MQYFLENNATAGSINIITDQSIKKGDQLNANLSVGSLGKFGSYFFSGTKNKKITSLLKETIILYFLMVTEEIVVIIKIMEVLNLHLTKGIMIFMLI